MWISLIFYNMKVCRVFSLELPNKYTQYSIFIIKKKITLNYPKSAGKGFFNNEFETAVVNKPSMFKPLKFYCKYLF